MREVLFKAWSGFMSTLRNAPLASPMGERLKEQNTQENQTLPPTTAEDARRNFRIALTDCVAGGWAIEIENEFDAVLSKKASFHWAGKLLIFLLLLFIFAPLALFYLIVVVVKGISSKPLRLRVWIDEDGRIQQREQF